MSVWSRLLNAFRAFWSLLVHGVVPADLIPLTPAASDQSATIEPARAAPTEDAGERAVQLLALLQRDGRLVDFFREDLTAYSDAQIGGAVRDVHDKCRATLERYLTIEPVSLEDEGQPYVVTSDSDPALLRVLGNAPAHGSTRGVVRHRGWRVTRIALPPLPHPDARHVVSPAEVEVS